MRMSDWFWHQHSRTRNLYKMLIWSSQQNDARATKRFLARRSAYTVVVVWPKSSSAHLLYYDDHHEESTRRPTCTSFHKCCLPTYLFADALFLQLIERKKQKQFMRTNFRSSERKIRGIINFEVWKNITWELCEKQVNLSFTSKYVRCL